MNIFFSYPFFIQGAIVVILLVLLILITAYFSIIVIRLKNSLAYKLRSKYEPQFRELFIHDIIANDDPTNEKFNETVSKFREFDLNNKKIRTILVNDILYFREQLSGSSNELLRKLYLELNLQARPIKDLQSSSFHVIIMAIRELLDMNIYESEIISSQRFLKHRNQHVREIARRYIITMEEQGVVRVFDSITEPISGIERLELFQVISELDILKIPDFGSWITNESPHSLVSLCLKLVVYYQQYRTVPVVLQLLETEDIKLKNEAINALGKLLQAEAEPSLVTMYDSQEEKTKAEIIKALGRIGSGKQLNLLEYIFDSEPAMELRKHAAKSIAKQGSQGLSLFKRMQKNASQPNRLILNHAFNSNIKY